MAKINRNITCPSAFPQCVLATTNANPAAFNIISTDSSIKTRFLRVSTPISPSANRIAANNNPVFIGKSIITLLHFVLYLFPLPLHFYLPFYEDNGDILFVFHSLYDKRPQHLPLTT